MNRGAGSEAGSLGIQTAVIILFCSIIAAAALAFLAFTAKGVERERRQADRAALRAGLARAVEAAMAAIEADPSPGSDSPLDPAYSTAGFEGAEVKIAEESSLLNPNWVRKGILEDTPLSGILKPGVSPSDLQQYREDKGISQNASHYADFLDPEQAKRFMGAYSYPVIGAVDEFALRRYCLDATGDRAAADSIFASAQSQATAGKALDGAGLRALLGVNYEPLSALITDQPQMNVNFVPEKILRAIVSYSAWAIPDSSKKWQSIALTRESAAVSQEVLDGILKVKADHPIRAYLGVRSWFWRIDAAKDGIRVEAIAARRLPYDPAKSEKGLTLVGIKEIEE